MPVNPWGGSRFKGGGFGAAVGAAAAAAAPPQQQSSGLWGTVKQMLRPQPPSTTPIVSYTLSPILKDYAITAEQLAASRGFIDRAYGLDVGAAQLDYDKASRGTELQRERASLERNFIQRALDRRLERLGIERERVPLEREELATRLAAELRGIDSQYTGRGAWHTPMRLALAGDARKLHDLAQAGLGLTERDIAVREQLERLQAERDRAGIDLAERETASAIPFLQRSLDLALQNAALQRDRGISGVDVAAANAALNARQQILSKLMGLHPWIWERLR